jgi:threonine aldolase
VGLSLKETPGGQKVHPPAAINPLAARQGVKKLMNKPVDLRSDTVTRPSAAMRQAMFECEVGDDCIDVDPTVEELQNLAAELLGKEAAIFMPSGTMTNQVALRVHCQPGDEFLSEAECHILNYEQAAYAQLSGLAAHPIAGPDCVLNVEQLEGHIQPDNESFPRTRLLCLENTHNRAGGKVLPLDSVVAATAWAHQHGLRTHLDGARLFNAVAASGVAADEWCKNFDTVSICFSKGLGAPVGSALVGSKELITQARRHRKAFGGGMRQAGVIAAAALYALQNNRQRLAEDHQHTQLLAEAIRQAEGLELVGDEAETNMAIFHVSSDLGTARQFAAQLEVNGVQTLALGPNRVRAVTHLDVDRQQVERAAAAILETAEQLATGSVEPANEGAQY